MESPSQKKQKLPGHEGMPSGNGSNAAGDALADIQKLLEKVEEVQSEIDKINEQASEEILKVEQKYNKLRQPMFSKRGDALEAIPQFWLNVFLNHQQLGSLLTERDEQLLQSLRRLDVTEFDDIKSGFRLTFHFDQNPFFSNKTVTREVHMQESGESKVTLSKIDWVAGHELYKRASSSAGHKRVHEDEDPLFGLLFNEELIGDQSVDDIAEILKDDIWPNPMQYFIGEVPLGPGEGEEEEEEEGEDELDEEGDPEGDDDPGLDDDGGDEEGEDEGA